MTLSEFLYEFRWFLLMPVITVVLSTIFRFIKDIAQGSYYLDMKDELGKRTEEMIKEEKQKTDIDEDLKKYFNYKE